MSTDDGVTPVHVSSGDPEGLLRQMLNAMLLDQEQRLHRLRRPIDAVMTPERLIDGIAAHVRGARCLLDTLNSARQTHEDLLSSEICRIAASALDTVESHLHGESMASAVDLVGRVGDLIKLAAFWRMQRILPPVQGR
jgi:hypothetical protein